MRVTGACDDNGGGAGIREDVDDVVLMWRRLPTKMTASLRSDLEIKIKI